MTESTVRNRVALVTGASRGIGEAIALALAREGVHVAVHFREREADAHRVAAAVRERGVRSLTVQADVSQSSAIDALVAEVERGLGSIHILVNNAGVTRPQKIEDITERDWDELMSINLKSAFLLTQRVLPQMRAGGWGRVVNVSSVAAQLGGVVGPHYAASKAGLHGLTHGYATFLAKEGITANTIAPALIATEMVTSNPRARPDLIPVGRFGLPEEVADVVVMVVRNGYITGQTINVNGGWYMS
jgi:3-oxoacyl-[acyl-carrier protein] reductase